MKNSGHTLPQIGGFRKAGAGSGVRAPDLTEGGAPELSLADWQDSV